MISAIDSYNNQSFVTAKKKAEKRTKKLFWLTGVHFGSMGNGMNKVLEGLYVGNLGDSRSVEQLTDNKISHILSIHDGAKPHIAGMEYLCIHADDSPTQPLSQFFGECIEFIHRARAKEDLSWREALNAVRGARHCANPNFGFQKQLQEWSGGELPRWRIMCKRWPFVTHDDRQQCKHLSFSSEDVFIHHFVFVSLLYLTFRYNLHKGLLQPDLVLENLSIHKKWVEQGDQHLLSSYPLANNAYKPAASLEEQETSNHNSEVNGTLSTDALVSQSPSTDASVSQSKSEPAKQVEHKGSRLRSAIRNTLCSRKGTMETGKITCHESSTVINNNTINKPKGKKSYTMSIFRKSSKPKDELEVLTTDRDIPDSASKSLSLPNTQQLHRSTPNIHYSSARLLRAYTPSLNTQSQPVAANRSYVYVQNSDELKRATDPRIPASLDRRLTRSKSVGILAMRERIMHRTNAASVIKLSDCEDWQI